MNTALILGGAVAAPVFASYLVEAFRSAPAAPDQLAWNPELPIRYLPLDVGKVRHVVAGDGPPLVLLHTPGPSSIYSRR